MRGLWILGIVSVLAAATLAAVRVWAGRPATVVATPTAIAAMRDFRPRVVATGSVRLAPGAKIDVGARESGVVRLLAVKQGSRVRRGDIIAELDDREARLRLADAEARVAELTAARTEAESDANRVRSLAVAGFASPRDLSIAQTAVTQAEARLASATAQRNLARVQLDYMTIRAPVDGVVASVTTHEGETVAASLSAPTFVTLVDLSRLECVALVDETDIGRVHVGDTAEFTVDAFPGRVFTGEVVRIAPDATIISGVVDYETTIRVQGSPPELRPQMTASITIESRAQRALVVPSAAVRQGATGVYVWRRSGAKIVRIQVRTGSRQADITQITGGLRNGDTVLTANFPESMP
ncbi:MAG: efflux RND transporter periplasmic adaptor subunit [Gemmatimonadaceae bacterium]